MKTTKYTIIIICLIHFIFSLNFLYATNYSWQGGTSTNWATGSNWSPNGIPTTNDTVTITSVGNQPVLDQTRSITKLTMTSGTLDLNTYDLTISHTTFFTSGTITNGRIFPTGVQAQYLGTTFSASCEVNSVSGKIVLSGSTFNYRCYFEDTITNSYHTGAGGCTFNAPVTIKKNSGAGFGIAGTSGNTFNDSVTFLNVRGSNTFTVTDQGTTYFNGHVIVGANTGGDILFYGPSTLASGKTIAIDATVGFPTGDLRINSLTQSGSTAQSFTLTSAATLNLYGTTWNGAVTFTSPHVLIRSNTFNNTTSLTQTSTTTGSNSYGTNTFNAAATISCSGGSQFRLGQNDDDIFNSDLTVSGNVQVGAFTTTTVKGNITAGGSSTNFNSSGVTGTLKFAGSNAQHISSGGTGIIVFNKMKIDKTGGSVTLDSTVAIDDTLTLVNKNIISTSSHYFSMLSGSTVTGASNSSFVEGPVKKTGTAAFVFPTGKNSIYRAIEMSAPSISTNAYTAEYFDAGQSLGNTMDASIKYIRDCGYWNFARNSGSSNVTVSLNWDTSPCALLDSVTVKVANWNGSTWKDLGNGGITGNKNTGKVANSTTVITWGYFALAYNKCFLTANAGSDQDICLTDSATIGASPVAGGYGMGSYTYSWYPTTGLSSSTVTNPKASPSSTTDYKITLTDVVGCSITDTVTVTHHPVNYTWTGSSSSEWATASNWSPSGIPGYCDHVTIVSGSNNVLLSANTEVNNFTINSGTINLQGNNLTIDGKSFFNAGNINNGRVNLTNTDTASFNGTRFGAYANISASKIFLNGSRFDSTAVLLQSGSSNTTSSGGNIFNGATTIKNTGSGNMYLANSVNDTANANITFYMSGNGTIYPSYTKNMSFSGNINLSYQPVPANGTVVFGSNGGKAIFNGSADQTLSYSYLGFGLTTNSTNADTMAIFKKLQMNKSAGTLALNFSVRVTDSLILTNGNIVTDTVNMLWVRDGAVVADASDNSFVAGPVKKFGNTAFVFPIGDYIHYRPLTISSPSLSSDAFMAQYFDNGQIQSDSLDTTLTEVSPCNYWLFLRKNGSSTVSISLPWDTSYCAVYDTSYMRLAFWNDTIWKDKGHGTFNVTATSGKMTSVSAVSNYGYYTLATNAAISLTCPTSPPFSFGGHTSSWVIGNIGGIVNNTITTNSVILIDGEFEIDQDFTFNNCPNIKMAPHAKITIDVDKTLSIVESTVKNCDNYQWNYIKITGSRAVLNVTHSVLEGADTAIWSNNGGVYHVNRDSRINRCYKGIMVDDYGFSHLGTIQDSWIGCATPPGGTSFINLLPPHASARTFRGIQVHNVNTIAIGTTSNANLDVDFYYMDKGIYSTTSTLNIHNCNFQYINFGGIAINALSVSGAHSINIGNSVNNRCNFSYCTKGIETSSMDVTANFNNFDHTDYAIKAYHSTGHEINYQNNEINYFIKGAVVYNSPNAEINILYNNFNAPPAVQNLSYYGTSAIEVINHVLDFNTVHIQNNLMHNTRTGIKVLNVNGTSLVSQNLRVSGNIVHYDITYNDFDLNLPPPNNHYGIKLNNCRFANIFWNELYRPTSLLQQEIDGHEWSRFFGIQTSKVYNSEINSNLIEYFSSGVNLRVNCAGTVIACNGFIECYRGVDMGSDVLDPTQGCLGNPATVSHQGTGDHYNSWVADAANNANDARVAGMASPGVHWYFYNLLNPVHWPLTGLSCNSANTPPTISTIDCPDPQLAPEEQDYDRENLIGAIVKDTLEYEDFPLERRYMQLSFAFRELDDDTNRLHVDSDDSIYIAFYNTHKHSNIGKFYTIEKLIKAQEYEDAADSLALITDTNTIESNRKTVLDIYLNTIIPDEEVNEEQISVLTDIAYDCALHGGPAVYEAWAILDIDLPDTCAGYGSRMAGNILQTLSNKSKLVYFDIMPNPAKNFININYATHGNDAIMSISDIAGRLLKKVVLSGHSGKIQINTSDLSEGVYIYSIKINGDKVKTGKFVIG